MRSGFQRLPKGLQRAVLGLAGIGLILGPVVFTIRSGYHGFFYYFSIWSVGSLLLTRAFAPDRLRGLKSAAERLGLRLDETGAVEGRVRGVAVRIVPATNSAVTATAPDGLGG